jgi:hypothetical protein
MLLPLLLASSLMADVHFYWNPPQSQFLQIRAVPGGPTKYVDFEGAVRAGKSTAPAAKLGTYAVEYPGIEMAASRWSQDNLDAQIKPLWRDTARQMGLGLRWNSAEEYDELDNGSRVYLRALKSGEDTNRYGKFAGKSLAVFWIDQPEETPQDVAEAYLPARLSQVGYPHEAWFTPNPVSEDHWLARWFPLDNRLPHHTYIHTSVYDNRHVLGDAYIADLEQQYPVGSALRRRFIDGLRGLGVVGDPVYAGYFQARVFEQPWHVRDDLRWDTRLPIYEGWDFGYSHPAVLWSQFVFGQWRVLAELMGAQQSIDDMIPLALQIRGECFPGAREFRSVCDPAGYAHSSMGHKQTGVQILRDAGIVMPDFELVKAYNAPQVEYGAIQRTMQLLRATVQPGVPSFVVSSRCQTFITGLEAGYIWSQKAGYRGTLGSVKRVEKEKETTYNHLQDCWLYTILRYGSAGLTKVELDRQAEDEAQRALIRAQTDYDPADRTHVPLMATRTRSLNRGGY